MTDAVDHHLLRAPWDAGQVAGLNRFQSGPFHPYTCGNDSRHILTATQLGWVCPQCDYTQDWVSDFAATCASNPEAAATSFVPEVGDRIRIALEGTVESVSGIFVRLRPASDADHTVSVPTSRSLVVSVEKLPAAEPEWLAGDVVWLAWDSGRGGEALLRGNKGAWFDRNGIRYGGTLKGSLTLLVRDGKTVAAAQSEVAALNGADLVRQSREDNA